MGQVAGPGAPILPVLGIIRTHHRYGNDVKVGKFCGIVQAGPNLSKTWVTAIGVLDEWRRTDPEMQVDLWVEQLAYFEHELEAIGKGVVPERLGNIAKDKPYLGPHPLLPNVQTAFCPKCHTPLLAVIGKEKKPGWSCPNCHGGPGI